MKRVGGAHGKGGITRADKIKPYWNKILKETGNRKDAIKKATDEVTMFTCGSTYYLKKGGILIVSGIIEERMDEVIDALKSVGFKEPEPEVREGWAAVKFTV